MTDTLPPADISQRVSAEQVHAQRLTALETATAKAVADITILDRHRERMETRWALVAACVLWLLERGALAALVGVLGAAAMVGLLALSSCGGTFRPR